MTSPSSPGSAALTVETVRREHIEALRASLPAGHYAIQWTIDALVPSPSHPHRRRNALAECVTLYNARLAGARP